MLLALVLALVWAGCGIARAAPSADGSPQLRGVPAMEIVVPLKEGQFYVGDVPVRVHQDQTVAVPIQPLLAIAAKVLRPDHVAKVRAALPPAEVHSIEALRAAGLPLAFDPLKVELTLTVGADQRARGAVSVLPFEDSIASEAAARPAFFSAYLNTRLGADYVWQSEAGDAGLDTPRADFEAAARIGGVVVEAEATLEGARVAGLGRAGSGDPRLVRRGTRVVYDLPEQAVRLKAGDVDMLRTSYQHGMGVLGVSVERAYGVLQPGRNIRSTGKRTFRVERPSNVAVKLDGIVFKQIRLEAGDYDLSDLPLRAGANNISLEIEDDTGQRQVLDFTSFSGLSLLARGVDEWGATAGLRSSIHDGELEYETDRGIASGFYRRGITDEFTAGGHLQADQRAVMGGAGFVAGTSYGLVSAEAAVSWHQEEGFGYAASIDYDLTNVTDRYGWRHSLRLGAEVWGGAFTTPGLDREIDPRWLEFGAQYSRTLPFELTASLSGRYALLHDGPQSKGGERWSAGASMHKQLAADVSLGLVASYQTGNERAEDNGFSGILRLTWRPDERSYLDFSHETLGHRSSAQYSRFEGDGVGSWNADIRIENAASNGEASASGGVQYVANRARLAAAHYTTADALYGLKGSRFDGSIREQRSTVRVETAIAYADGRVAVGRPITNGFAIVDTHPTLAGRGTHVGRSRDRVEARSDGLGPLLVSDVSAYSTTRLQYDVADLPPGYDLGAGAFDIAAPHRAGYALEVGSAYTVTATGTLIGGDGLPVGLLTGTASESGKATPRKVEVFTNRQGRFSAQGLAPGRWVIEMRNDTRDTFTIVVPAGAVGLYEAGELRVGAP